MHVIMKKFSKHDVKTVFLEVGIVLGILKKSYLKLAILFLCIAIHLQAKILQ